MVVNSAQLQQNKGCSYRRLCCGDYTALHSICCVALLQRLHRIHSIANSSSENGNNKLPWERNKLSGAADDTDTNVNVYDLVVIGGGVVGLAILRAATLEGWKCALVEQEPDLLSWASGSNSGIACTGVDAKPGTLERALIRDSASQIRIFCKEMNIPNRPCGSLVCQWPWDLEDRLKKF
jgi:hypothetical protein